MSYFRSVELKHVSRLLNHGPTVLITSRDTVSKRKNVMAAAWSTPVEFAPPRVAIVVDKGAWTRELIETGGAFGICIPTAANVDLTYAVGSVSGREEDKFNRFAIPSFDSSTLGVPLIEEGCSAWLECRLLPEAGAQQKYDTLFGEVIAAAADERIFSQGRWQFESADPSLFTLHHLGAGSFICAGKVIAAKPR
ncbi:Flavin reductase like domain [Leminorella richardii]|uniref:Flavin reductase like domain n=1 Tax=Leminorella richardii TaxID=158841 RepID=A0A2X4UQ61_9GAMM|nr:flavin reductase family protein [Leminorella richardii]SQI40931.1 Flavin reductase like domain [Leminorella richardii]